MQTKKIQLVRSQAGTNEVWITYPNGDRQLVITTDEITHDITVDLDLKFPGDECGDQMLDVLVSAYTETFGKPMPWRVAIELLAVARMLDSAERDRLLAMGD